MQLKFLGTSAGELYPGLWCRCRNCQKARRGDERDRRQSAALYVESTPSPDAYAETAAAAGILIDFPSEIASQALRHHLELPELCNLLITHSHGDHWFPYLLRWRSAPVRVSKADDPAPCESGAPRFTELPILHIWGNAAVETVLRRELGENLVPFAIEFHRVGSGDTFAIGDMTITALQANHDFGREEALHYVVQDGRSTLLYGLDGDTFLTETRDALRTFRFDVVILESTYGFGEGKNHRNFVRLLEEAAWFRAEDVLVKGGSIIATHFSPHHCPPFQETDEYLSSYSILTAWDGMALTL